MREQFQASKPDVVHVNGLTPITPLLVAQFEEALDRRPEVERTLRADGRIEFDLRGSAHVVITAYRLRRLYRTRD